MDPWRNLGISNAVSGAVGGSGAVSGSVPESSRARSRLEDVHAQTCSEIRAREEYSTTSSPLVPHNMQKKLKQE